MTDEKNGPEDRAKSLEDRNDEESTNQPHESNVHHHPSIVDAYLRLGWKLIPIPHGSKGPVIPAWNQPGSWLKSADYLPDQFNIGLQHAYTGTAPLDIDDWDATVKIIDEYNRRNPDKPPVDLNALFYSETAVGISTGNKGHAKLLFQLPPGVMLPSVKFTTPDGKTACELRNSNSAGTTVQDVLPPSKHPNGNTYKWVGAGHWSALPPIPDSLMRLWLDKLSGAFDGRVDPPSAPPTVAGTTQQTTSLAEARKALLCIPADIDRDSWVRVGMAIHAIDPAQAGFELYDWWSQGVDVQSVKYAGRNDVWTRWRSFKPKEDGIGPGTLFEIAKHHGWRPSPPDVSEMFAPKDGTPNDYGIYDVFKTLRTPRPKLDLALIPEPIRHYAELISRLAGSDPLVSVFAGIAAVAGCIDNRSKLDIRYNYAVSAIIWLASVGDPSNRKTPGSAPMFAPLHAMEREDIARYEMEMRKYQVIEKKYKKDFDSWMEAETSGLTDNTVAHDYPKSPGKPPVPLLLTVSDITSQALLVHCEPRPRGVLTVLDEMSRWFELIGDKKTTENRNTWTMAYEGRSAKKDTKAQGSQVVDPFGVSIYGNIQPAAWKKNVDLISDDGFIQRFCLAILRPDYTRKPDTTVEDATREAGKQWDMLLRKLFALPVQQYKFSPDAQKLFEEHESWCLTKKKMYGAESAGKERALWQMSFGKAEGVVARLALIFHVTMEPHVLEIPHATLHQAIRFYREYLNPALRYCYMELGRDDEQSFEIWLATYILSMPSDLTEIGVRDLKRICRHRFGHLKNRPQEMDRMLQDAMMHLEAAQWVAPIETKGIHPNRWAVNPHLFDVLSNYRQQAIVLRRKLQEQFETSIEDYKEKKKAGETIPGFREEWLSEISD